MVGCPIRTPADQFPFADPRSFSQLITSFFASESLGIPHTPFLTSIKIRLSIRPLLQGGAGFHLCARLRCDLAGATPLLLFYSFTNMSMNFLKVYSTPGLEERLAPVAQFASCNAAMPAFLGQPVCRYPNLVAPWPFLDLTYDPYPFVEDTGAGPVTFPFVTGRPPLQSPLWRISESNR